MKITVVFTLTSLVMVGVIVGYGVLQISPHPIELKQVLFISITILTFIALIILHLI